VSWKQWAGSGNPGNPEDVAKTGYDDSAWKQLESTASSKKTQVGKGSTWFRGTLTVAANQVDSILQGPAFGGAQTSLYLNGRRLSSPSQDVSKLLVAGKNTLLVQIQSKKDISGKLALSIWHNSPLGHANWYFHGGLAGLQETAIVGRVTNWSEFLTSQPWKNGDPTTPNLPTFWKSTFAYHHSAGMRETIGLLTNGLKAGHVWLNGHNLGECPQKVPMYMPECWLKDGDNDLVVFDLYGTKPDQVRITRYEAFSVVNMAAAGERIGR